MNFINNFKRGYYRPISMPNWKWIIIYTLLGITIITYILAMFVSWWLIFLGLIFQTATMHLPLKWDTGSWKDTDKGKEYIEKYM